MSRDTEWFRLQSEYNKQAYERLQVACPDLIGWKVTVLFYSALHRANYWFDTRRGAFPRAMWKGSTELETRFPMCSTLTAIFT